MDQIQFHAINLPPTNPTAPPRADPSPSNVSDFFTLAARPGTAIWRSPNCQSNLTAPMLITCLRQPFLVAEVTVSADFDMEWDQGGLIIFAGSPGGELGSHPNRRRRGRHGHGCEIEIEHGPASTASARWVKAGLEFTGGMLNASSVVATSEAGADWSLSPLFPFNPDIDSLSSPAMSNLRIKFERVGDSLWIWYKIPSLTSYSSPGSPGSLMAEWRKMREVMGFFGGVEAKGGVWVGCYASRPMRHVPTSSWDNARPEANELLVEFEEFEIL